MKYGHFSKDGTEFIITNPSPPRPWINYLTNEDYCAIISQVAGGYSFYKDCRNDRLLRWEQGNWEIDRPGRYLFIRDKDTRKSWSATFQPLRIPPKSFQARHGLGYTTIETNYYGIRSELTYFVPRKDTCEVCVIKISNLTKCPKNLEVFPYVEWLIGDFHMEIRYRNIMNLYNRIWFDKETNSILGRKTAVWGDMNIQPNPYLIFFAGSLPVKGYATQKESSLGRFRTEANPDFLGEGKFKNSEFCSGEDGIGLLKHELKLKPGETKEFVVVMGQTLCGDMKIDGRHPWQYPKAATYVKKLLDKYRDLDEAKRELEKVKKLWQKRILGNVRVETPDKDFDKIVNVWVKYQLYICNFWSRSPSYYHESSGGRGYRDSCQDAESIVSIDPELTRKKIIKIASLIRQDGTSAPGWSDTTGPANHRPNKDHQIWLTPTVASYIKETGDKEILLKHIPYLKDCWIKGWEIDRNWKGGAAKEGAGTLFEHLEKNLNFTFSDVGERGLPLIGHADWNDGIDAAGIKHKGESVWLAMALVRSLKILAELANLINKKSKAKAFLDMAKVMSGKINKIAWDGQWYSRGFTDEGYNYGAGKNEAGKIFLNPQSWAILSGVAKGERLKKLIASTDKYLDGKYGYALFYPAYSNYDPRLGRMTMFSEGTKENAAVFCHAATFMTVANCMAGRGNTAYRSMKKIMPNAQDNYELYKTEPYAYAEYLIGPEHPYRYGEGAFTWITGTAGWNFMAATEWILGVQHDYKGLLIDPCFPEKWKECRVSRPSRGANFEIHIKNPRGVQKGVKEILVNGKKIKGNIIRNFRPGKTYQVEVVMG